MNYQSYLDYLKELGYEPIVKVAYGNQKETVIIRFIRILNGLGFQTNFKFGKSWFVELILHAVSLTQKVECVVLGTADPVYYPLATWLQAHGIKVDVVACNIPKQLSEIAICHEIERRLIDVETPEIPISGNLSSDSHSDGL